MPKSAYIHIPFCKRKCNYCTFVSYDKLNLKNDYIDALIKEIRANYKNEVLDTIYFGGGTPSILSADDFKIILDELNFDNNTEITVELNPESVTKTYLALVKDSAKIKSELINLSSKPFLGGSITTQSILSSSKIDNISSILSFFLSFHLVIIFLMKGIEVLIL